MYLNLDDSRIFDIFVNQINKENWAKKVTIFIPEKDLTNPQAIQKLVKKCRKWAKFSKSRFKLDKSQLNCPKI